MSKEGWTTVSLGDIAENISVRVDNPSKSGLDRFVGLVHLVSGSVSVSRWDSTESVTSSMKQFQAGDVLLARRNAHLRRASAVDFEGVCSGDAYVLREKPDVIVPGLLKYILNMSKFWEYAIANADGSMSTRVKWRDLERYEFSLPSKNIQKNILRMLEINQKCISNYSTASTNLEILASSALNSLIHRGINQSDKLREVCLGSFDSKKYTFPENWGIMPLRELVVNHKAGIFKPKKLFGKGHNIVGVSNLYAAREIDGRIFNRVELTPEEIEEYSLSEGDLIYGESSLVREGIAKVLYTNSLGKGTVFAWHTRKIVVDQGRVDPYFLSLVLNSTFCRRFIISRSTTTALTGMTVQGFLETPIPLPPVDEQKEIGRKIRQILDQFDIVESHIAGLQEILKIQIEKIGGH